MTVTRPMKQWGVILSIVALQVSWQGAPLWSECQTAGGQPTPAEDTPAQEGKQPPAQPQRSGNIKEWVQVHQRSKKSALIGAATGAVIGALIFGGRGGKVWQGAAAGALAGGVAGYLVGRHRDQIFASRDEAVRLAGYVPSQGYVIKIQEVRFDPLSIKPGESATLHIRYLVIGPDPGEAIRVNCFRGIKYQDSYLVGEGPVAFTVPHGGGIVNSTAEFTLPKEAPAGTYSGEAMLDDPQGRFQNLGASSLYIAS